MHPLYLKDFISPVVKIDKKWGKRQNFNNCQFEAVAMQVFVILKSSLYFKNFSAKGIHSRIPVAEFGGWRQRRQKTDLMLAESQL